MTYVIADPCIGTKDASCVEVCPVDCIHPTPGEAGYELVDQLFVDPAECIDCDACTAACPVQAIMPESDVPEDLLPFIAKNARYFVSDGTSGEA